MLDGFEVGTGTLVLSIPVADFLRWDFWKRKIHHYGNGFLFGLYLWVTILVGLPSEESLWYKNMGPGHLRRSASHRDHQEIATLLIICIF